MFTKHAPVLKAGGCLTLIFLSRHFNLISSHDSAAVVELVCTAGGQLVILQACTAAAAAAATTAARGIVTPMTHETNLYATLCISFAVTLAISHAKKFSPNKINDK